MSYVTMVTSGKGGVGKSGCCVMLGAALSRLGKKVLLIELDSGLRSLDIMGSTTASYTIYATCLRATVSR